MWGGDDPVCGEEMRYPLVEGHALPPGPRLFLGAIYMLVLDLHPFHPALHPVLVGLHVYQLGNVREPVPIPVIFAELVLGLLLT